MLALNILTTLALASATPTPRDNVRVIFKYLSSSGLNCLTPKTANYFDGVEVQW